MGYHNGDKVYRFQCGVFETSMSVNNRPRYENTDQPGTPCHKWDRFGWVGSDLHCNIPMNRNPSCDWVADRIVYHNAGRCGVGLSADICPRIAWSRSGSWDSLCQSPLDSFDKRDGSVFAGDDQSESGNRPVNNIGWLLQSQDGGWKETHCRRFCI